MSNDKKPKNLTSLELKSRNPVFYKSENNVDGKYPDPREEK